jgi:hypothetical protein
LSIREANLGHFAESRVRLLRCACHHLHANAATLWAVCQSGRLGFDFDFLAPSAAWVLTENKSAKLIKIKDKFRMA